jgi:hypothetical protein
MEKIWLGTAKTKDLGKKTWSGLVVQAPGLPFILQAGRLYHNVRTVNFCLPGN